MYYQVLGMFWYFKKAGLPGLEPRTTVPKTAVLPITP
jgi:hypothetical protein